MLAVFLGSTRGLCGAAELVGSCAEYVKRLKETKHTPLTGVDNGKKKHTSFCESFLMSDFTHRIGAVCCFVALTPKDSR